MYRFFVTARSGDAFILSDEALHHLRVVRAQNEHFICVYEALFFECSLVNNKAQIVRQIDESHEHGAPVILALALIEEASWEIALVKSVELGVTQIVPLITARTSKHLLPRFAERIARYQKKVVGAAEQSFRNVVPALAMPMTFADALSIKAKHRYLAHEQAHVAVQPYFLADVIFFVGPEGGFTDLEVVTATTAGVIVVSLGPRILRAETAALTLLAKTLTSI